MKREAWFRFVRQAANVVVGIAFPMQPHNPNLSRHKN
jgi:hypothetical protein